MPLDSPGRKQRNVFFVDTKSTCFLCLQETLPEAPVIDLDDEEGDEQIKKMGPCENFRGVSRKTDKHAVGIKSEKFCLRSIHNYLKMNPGKVLSSYLTSSPLLAYTAGSQLLNTDLSVVMCGNCTTIATHLANLCIEMEVLQMKVAHSLEKFENVLKISEKNTRLNENFRKKLANPTDFFQGSMAEILRKETQTKCRKVLENSGPKVDLDGVRVTTSPIIIPSSSPTLTSNVTLSTKVPPINEQAAKNLVTPARYKCKFCALPFGSTSGLHQHIRRNHRKNSMPSSSTAAPTVLSHGCAACGAILPSKADWIRHTRLYCNSRRLGGTPILSATNTEPMIMELPTTSIVLDNKHHGQDSAGEFTTPPAVSVSAILKSLCKLQTVSKELVCTLCSAADKNNKFSGETELTRHIFCRHAEHFFATAKLAQCTKKQFKEECERMIIKEIDMSQTVVLHDDDSNESKFICRYCPSEYFHKRTMRAHLIQNHHDKLAVNLVALQKNLIGHPVNNSVEKNLNSPVKSNFRMRTYKPDVLMRRRHKCYDCGEMFVQSSSLCRHRRLYCRYRKESNQNSSSTASISTNSKTANFVGRKKSKHVGTRGSFKCLDCGAGFAHSPSLWRHRKTLHHTTGHVPAPNKKLRKYLCQICGRGFVEERHLRMHCLSTVCGKMNRIGRGGSDTADIPKAVNNQSANVQQYNNVMSIPSLLPLTRPFLVVQNSVPVVTSTSATTSVNNRVNCEYCKKTFSSNCVMRRHQRQNCPLAKAAAAVKMYGSSESTSEVAVPETEYFGEEMEEEVEVYRDSYSDSKVNILEMSQVQLCKSSPMHEEEFILGELESGSNVSNSNTENESSVLVKLEHEQREEMMIIPDSLEDPVQ